MKTKRNSTTGKITILRTIIFILVLCGLLFYLNRVFDMKDNKQSEQVFNTFYAEQDNTLDGIYFGSSATYRYFMPTYAYEKYGMAVYNMATSAQPLAIEEEIIKEALKSQSDVKFILIELRNIIKADDGIQEADLRRVTDAMNFSVEKIRAVDAGLDYYKSRNIDIDYNKYHYYVPFLKYHNRWEDDITLEDWSAKEIETPYKGFITNGAFYTKLDQNTPGTYAGKAPLGKVQTEVLKDLLKYCKTLNQTVIFVSSPYNTKKEKYERMNTAMEMCKDAGFTVWNFNQEPLRSEIDMDWDDDYFQTNHTNIYGAEKYTRFVAKKLKEKLNIPDHRGESKYKSWDIAAKALNKEIKAKTKENNDK